ncbi:uncharacterized protein LOC143610302 [Bidens hawaiensis]|uniref:uncharacterized protein LOC143610302 n=1 Tax=Bidens hawaiensis TaxID=980011 RepID=UPI00404B12F9
MVYKNRKFDLNEKPTILCCDDELNKDNKFNDTALRLECFGHGTVSLENTRPRGAKSMPRGGYGLVVGVGPASSLSESDLALTLGLSGCSSASKSDVNSVSDNPSSSVEVSNEYRLNHDLDEGSTSTKSSGGYMPSLLLAPRISVPLKKLKITEPENVHDRIGFRVARDGVKRRLAPGSTKSARGRSVLLVPHGSMVQESKENKNASLGNTPRFIHGLVLGQGPGSCDNRSLSGSSAVSNSTGWIEKPAKRRQMIPPQVLVPSSMKSSLLLPVTRQPSSGTHNNGGRESLERAAPEDRVHGGSLLSLLMGSNLGN